MGGGIARGGGVPIGQKYESSYFAQITDTVHQYSPEIEGNEELNHMQLQLHFLSATEGACKLPRHYVYTGHARAGVQVRETPNKRNAFLLLLQVA